MTSAESWERSLLRLARLEEAEPPLRPACPGGDAVLDEAYRLCGRITAEHSRTFSLAAALLPPAKRRAMHALYAFCRTTDDIVDEMDGSRAALAAWEREALAEGHHPQEPVALAWRDAVARHGIPPLYARQLVETVAQDLSVDRYATFEDLSVYCYGVAVTVGLMAMRIVGYRGGEAEPSAIRLGVALQLTNILRDVGEDWRSGRLYLPLDELARFGLSEGEVAAGQLDERWRGFMAYQIERARRLYRDALPGLSYLHQDGRFAVAAAAELYRGILDDIEAHDYDVFNRRAHLGGGAKLARLPGIWWRATTGAYRAETI